MRDGRRALLLTLVLAFMVMSFVNSQFPEFANQLGTFFTYVTFIGIVILLTTGGKSNG